jgi:lipopolysaccharide transport system permease protein
MTVEPAGAIATESPAHRVFPDGRTSSIAVTVIEPTRGWSSLRLGELWAFRELFYHLLWRDVKVRYKQTALGAAWAILQPLLTMLVFSVFFGALAGLPSDGVPYPLFAYVALVPWTFFANGLTLSSNSLVSNQALLRKVYFPRLLVPIAAIASGVIDFVIAFVVLVGMVLWFGRIPTANVLWLPVFLLLALVTALGAGVWFSALNVRYRDMQYVVPFVVQVWLYSTPIVYPASIVPAEWRTLYAVNPMVGVVEGFRWALLGTGQRPGAMVGVSAIVATALLLSGLFVFRRMERTFADVV